jgi:hypothetical protein
MLSINGDGKLNCNFKQSAWAFFILCSYSFVHFLGRIKHGRRKNMNQTTNEQMNKEKSKKRTG